MARLWLPLLLVALLGGARPASAQDRPDGRVEVSFEDATLPELVRFVARHTRRRFILSGPMREVRVSIVSERPVTVAELWDGFLAVLAQNGLTAVRSGAYYRIVETEGIEGRETPVVPDGERAPGGEAHRLQVLRVEAGSVEDAAALLRHVSSPGGTITAYPPSRALVVSDTARNIERMRIILRHVSAERAGATTHVHRLQHADAEELAQSLSQLAPVRAAR